MESIVTTDDQNLAHVPQLLSEGKVVVLRRPKGNSMLPFIRGEMDSVKLRKAEGVKVGHIVLALCNGRPIVHRVVALDGRKVTLMGDGNIEGTERIDLANVLGIVDEIIAPTGRSHKPGNGWLWRKLLPVRKYLLKAYRKWNRTFIK